MSRNLFSSSLRGAPRAGICSVCGSSLGILFCCPYYDFLDYLLVYVCIYGVRGDMYDTELLGENRLFGAWSIQ